LFLIPTMYLILEELFPRRFEEETNNHGTAFSGTSPVPDRPPSTLGDVRK
jgi:hypothetical protein